MNAFLGLLLSYLKTQRVDIELPNLTISLQDYPIRVTFPDLKITTVEILGTQTFLMVRDIQMILEDDDRKGRDCSQQIEAIKNIFSDNHIPIKDRHDHG